MKKNACLICLLVLVISLQSCKPTPKGLFKKIASETGFTLSPNPNGTDNVTKSVIIEVPYSSDNLDKVGIITNSIDSYLKMMPTVKKKGEFDGNLNDYYEWENSELKVWLRIRYSSVQNQIRIILFYTEK